MTLKIASLCLFAVSINAATYTVKAGGGGNYSTIQACANVANPGDTCVVYAGTYNENPTPSRSGSAGSPITFTVNPGDTVQTYPWSINANWVIVNGFLVTDPSQTHGGYGIDISHSQNHITISNNTITQVGSAGPCIMTHGSAPSSYITITGNTISWCNAVPGKPNANAATGIEVNTDHFLVQNNRISHTTNGISGGEDHTAIIGNSWGPLNDPVDFPGCFETQGCDTHADFVELLQGSNTQGYVLIEGNSQFNILGVGGAHGWLANPPNGAVHTISRFNTQYSVGSGYLGYGGTTNMAYWKDYNNTLLNNQTQENSPSGESVAVFLGSPYGAFLNNLMVNDANPAGGAKMPYYIVQSDSVTGFVGGHNIMWDAACSPATLSNCASGLAATDAGNRWVDPKLVAIDGSNFSLQAGSPALGTGINLTSVASGDASSGTTLVVNDAGFFQDGLNLSGIQGDCVSVGTATNHACITAVNYATNTLTLASSISRSPGDPVWLFSNATGTQVLTGSAPDVGAAIGSIAVTSSAPLPPPSLTAVAH